MTLPAASTVFFFHLQQATAKINSKEFSKNVPFGGNIY